MTTILSFRLIAVVFVLALPIMSSSVCRCAAQEKDPLQAARDAQRAAEGKAALRVVFIEARALVRLPFAPDESYDRLKAIRDDILSDDRLSDTCRNWLNEQLECTLRAVSISGSYFKRLEAEVQVQRAMYRTILSIRQEQLRSLFGQE